MKQFSSYLLFFSIILVAAPAFAEDGLGEAGNKLGRGLSNTAFGWSEILKRQEEVADKNGPIAAAFQGTIQGTGNALSRTFTGIFETLTFPVRTTPNGDPMIYPEYPGQSDRAGDRPKDYSF